MSKGMNIPDGTTVYVPVVRENGNDDDHESTKFVIGGYKNIYLRDESLFTEEELKAKFSTYDWPLDQGDDIKILPPESEEWIEGKFIAFYEGNIVVQCDQGLMYSVLWKRKNEITLTIEEIEEKLGMKKGSLTIIN